MRRSRTFRPAGLLPLESRLAPSSGGIHPTADGSLTLSNVQDAFRQRAVSLPAAEVAQSNASNAAFGHSISETIEAGAPVAEQLTTTFLGGGKQTESILEIPNSSNNSLTTYKTIDLRNNGGIEKVVDTATFSGGTSPFAGTSSSHTITTTLPGGSIQTETETVVSDGPKTTVSATIHEASGGVETWTSVNIRHGSTTTANKTITEPDGTHEHQRTVTKHFGDLDWTSWTTTTKPGEVLVSSAATNVIRVQPPSAS
jgi:hypothetical protein